MRFLHRKNPGPFSTSSRCEPKPPPARSTPLFFSGLPSCLRIAPVPQPASRIAFWRQSGTSLSRFSKMSRCSARYHQCVSSTRNMVAYSSACIVPEWRPCLRSPWLPDIRWLAEGWFLVGTRLNRVTDDILPRVGVIEVKSSKVLAYKTKNHQLDARKENDTPQHCRNANR